MNIIQSSFLSEGIFSNPAWYDFQTFSHSISDVCDTFTSHNYHK